MRLFRPEDRLEQDGRVLVIRDPDEFRLYREREKLGFKGLLYRQSISDELRAAIAYCKNSAKKMTYKTRDGDFLEYGMDDMYVPLAAAATGMNLQQMFEDAVGGHTKVSLRFDSDYPRQFHQHATALTYAVDGLGTVCRNQDDRQYLIEAGEVLICEDIWHRAPSAEENQSGESRANYVLIQDPLHIF